MPGKKSTSTLILNGLFLHTDLPKVYDKSSSLDIIFKKAKKLDIERIILLQNGKIKNVPEGIKNVVLKNFYPFNILDTIEKESKNTDNAIVFNVGNPFFDIDFVNKMISRHEDYIADYTYGIGYPDGLIPSILRKDIIKEIKELVKNDHSIKKDFIYYSISKDINSFDIETFLADHDLRIYRIGLGNNDKGEEILTKKAYDYLKEKNSVNDVVEYFAKNIEGLYTTIYLVTLELCNYERSNDICLPENREEKSQIDKKLVYKIVDESIKENDKINFILGGIGDPLLHNSIIEIIEYILKKGIDLIIETNGNEIKKEFIDKLNNIDKDKLTFVIKLDAYNEDTYKKMHSAGDMVKVKQNIELLKENGFKVYKQITRMIENEVEIENYIRNKATDDLIIRKYSTFCNIMNDKKVVDLSPIERIPCFHLRRELYVTSNGNVPACLYSRYKSKIGDLNNESLNDVMKKLNNEYIKNTKKEYLEYCINCDDYYLFNF